MYGIAVKIDIQIVLTASAVRNGTVARTEAEEERVRQWLRVASDRESSRKETLIERFSFTCHF